MLWPGVLLLRLRKERLVRMEMTKIGKVERDTVRGDNKRHGNEKEVIKK